MKRSDYLDSQQEYSSDCSNDAIIYRMIQLAIRWLRSTEILIPRDLREKRKILSFVFDFRAMIKIKSFILLFKQKMINKSEENFVKVIQYLFQ